jgi:homoserine dehydrogenase
MPDHSPSPPFRIGMIGAGTVGGGVYDIIMGQYPRRPTIVAGRTVVITHLLVRSLEKTRDFHIHEGVTQVITDPALLSFTDGSMDCLVEVAGGCGNAKNLMIQALRAGIPVVTANKAALFEYNSAFNQASLSGNGRIGMEAAVCGGIPIINMLQTAYVGDRINSICGICNGTTNYMLSKMEQDPTRILYTDALKEAQELGYAEADPTADVEGHDVRAKIALLAQLAYGVQVPMDQIPCSGISNITADDFLTLKELHNGSTIKLLGRATVTMNDASETGSVCVYVTPTMVPASSTLAKVSGSGNAVQVTSRNLQTCTYMGPGAGRLPTANSVVADIYRAVKSTLPMTPFPTPSSYSNIQLNIASDYSSCFYIRVTTASDSELENVFSNALAEFGVAVKTVANGACAVDGSHLYTSVTTETHPVSLIRHLCDALQEHLHSFIVGSPLYMPILE